jgi:hypothetical protein
MRNQEAQMRTFVFTLAAGIALAGAAAAHPATEQYIPIGQSPGADTVQGTAYATAEPATAGGAPTVSVDVAGDYQNYVVGPNTRIYVDRSAQGRPSTLGTIEDVQVGRVIEVRLADAATRVAAWIKVRP